MVAAVSFVTWDQKPRCHCFGILLLESDAGKGPMQRHWFRAGLVAPTCNPGTEEAEAGGSQGQG